MYLLYVTVACLVSKLGHDSDSLEPELTGTFRDLHDVLLSEYLVNREGFLEEYGPYAGSVMGALKSQLDAQSL